MTEAPHEVPAGETAAPHPEEMKASVTVQIGKAVTISASARTTPAGLVCTALLVAATLVPVVMLVRRRVRG